MSIPRNPEEQGLYPNPSNRPNERAEPSPPNKTASPFIDPRASLPTRNLEEQKERFSQETLTYPIFDRDGKVARVIEASQGVPAPEKAEAQRPDFFPEEGLREPAARFLGLISRNPQMGAIFQLLRQVSSSDAAILIYGETGVGKQLIAEAIHQNSSRRNSPFVTVDCGSLPETLLESELFGYVRGAFTGALRNKRGLFEEATGGTLFLDEIGDASPALQAKLLRLLQEGEARPVGGTRSVKVDVRVVAATNKSLKEAVARRSFREDLYYRVAVVPIAVPPLRERPEDISLLARYFVEKFATRNRKGELRLSDEAMALLLRLPWPGNVRELQNVIERATLISSPPEILPQSLFMKEGADGAGGSPFVSPCATMEEAVSKVEREQILDPLRRHKWNKSLSARSLGISRACLYHKLKRYRIGAPIQPS